MTKHWGYPEQSATVEMAIPADMVDVVSQFVQDPQAFLEALTPTEQSLNLVMVEVEPGTWVDPRRIAAIRKSDGVDGLTRIYLTGLDGHFAVAGSPEDLLQGISEKLKTVGGQV